METIRVQSRVGEDGILRLQVPVGVVNTELDVVLVVQPLGEQTEQDEWLSFLERTAGILADDPITRPPQGDYETREPVE